GATPPTPRVLSHPNPIAAIPATARSRKPPFPDKVPNGQPQGARSHGPGSIRIEYRQPPPDRRPRQRPGPALQRVAGAHRRLAEPDLGRQHRIRRARRLGAARTRIPLGCMAVRDRDRAAAAVQSVRRPGRGGARAQDADRRALQRSPRPRRRQPVPGRARLRRRPAVVRLAGCAAGRVDRLHPHPRRYRAGVAGFPRADGQAAPDVADGRSLRAGAAGNPLCRNRVRTAGGRRCHRRRLGADLLDAPARDRAAAAGGGVIERAAAAALVGTTRLLVGARAQWRAAPPAGQCLYFANHSSHLDTMAIWSALDPARPARTRPVAARDYWNKPGLRGYVAGKVLHAVLIERRREERDGDPLEPVIEALRGGDSLILFPEGTRTAERL